MIDWIAEPLSHGTTVRALVEITILGLISGAVGCWVVLFEVSYSAESLAHGMFPGLVGAALLGLPLLLGGAVGIVFAALLIARALTADADLLLMDEPFTGLDSANEARLEGLIDRLAESGRTVMIATHEVEQAEKWDLVLCLNREQISFGTPAEALSKPVLEATYGGHIVEIPGQPDLGVLPSTHHHHTGEDHR